MGCHLVDAVVGESRSLDTESGVGDLKISARLGQQWYNYRYFYYRPMSIGRNSTPAYGPELASYNIARSSSTYDIDRLGEFTASYKKQLGRHHVDALIGYTLLYHCCPSRAEIFRSGNGS